MRCLAILLVALALLPSVAAADERYDNARFGYRMEVPNSFSWGAEAANGDGRAFRDGATRLLVWGGNIAEGSFEAAVVEAMAFATADGWSLSYQAVTPSWASFSGSNSNNRVLYQRMIALCDGSSYAAFQLIYSTRDMAKLDPAVDALVRSLQASC